MDKIDLCIFICSLDRYGRTNDFKIMMNQLQKLISLDYFNNKFLSFKILENTQTKHIEDYFKLLNFNIYFMYGEEFKGNRSNNWKELTHGTILKDICTFFVNNEFSEYLFLIEDDAPIIIMKDNLEYYINLTKKWLIENKNLHTISFVRRGINRSPCNDPDKWFEHHLIKTIDKDNIIRKDYWFNFQPKLVKSKEIVRAAKNVLENWDYFQFLHPEEGFKQSLLKFNPNLEFWAFDPFYGTYCIHLGEPPGYHEQLLSNEPEILKLYYKL